MCHAICDKAYRPVEEKRVLRDVDSQLPAKRARRPGVTEMTHAAGAPGPADAPEQMPDAQGPRSPDRDDPSSVSADSSSTSDAGPRARAARALQATHSGDDALEEAYMVPDDAVEEAHMVPGAEEDTPGAAARDDTSDVPSNRTQGTCTQGTSPRCSSWRATPCAPRSGPHTRARPHPQGGHPGNRRA